MVDAFEGNTAETKTIIPLIQRFVAAHGIGGVTVVADAGMMSEANLADIEDAGWSFVIGGKLPDVPYLVKQCGKTTPTMSRPTAWSSPSRRSWGRRPTSGAAQSSTSTRPTGPAGPCTASSSRSPRPEKAVAGQAAIKRNRFLTLTGGTRTVNRDLEAKVRALAGWKPYVTNIVDADPAWIIGAYHHLWRIEHAFRMSKHDLRARPVYHRKRESIDAHLTVVFAALAVSHRIETRTGWTIKKFVRALRRYRTVKINTGSHTLTAEDPLPDDIREALTAIHQGAH